MPEKSANLETLRLREAGVSKEETSEEQYADLARKRQHT
jgi:hypothetical protein